MSHSSSMVSSTCVYVPGMGVLIYIRLLVDRFRSVYPHQNIYPAHTFSVRFDYYPCKNRVTSLVVTTTYQVLNFDENKQRCTFDAYAPCTSPPPRGMPLLATAAAAAVCIGFKFQRLPVSEIAFGTTRCPEYPPRTSVKIKRPPGRMVHVSVILV